MKTLQFFSVIFLQFFLISAYADSVSFVTPRDILANDPTSNINLHNNKNSATTVFGLYVRQFALVVPGQSCNQQQVIYSTTQNTTAGSFVTPVSIGAGKSSAIGGNFLYNMIYNAEYYVNIVIPSSPPGCALPGCTWGSDSTKYNWCIYLGALAPVSNTSTYTASVPPATDTPSSAGNYNYDLVNNYMTLGPISCNDQTLTCVSATLQTQSFS